MKTYLIKYKPRNGYPKEDREIQATNVMEYKEVTEFHNSMTGVNIALLTNDITYEVV